jgi:uncharacterized membrane protein
MSIFKDIANFIGGAAPLIGGLVGGPLGAGVGKIIGSALGVDGDDENAVHSAIKNDPEAYTKLKAAEQKFKLELERLTLKQAEILAAERINTIQQVNLTMRSEAGSNDAFVRRWRPFFGYVVSVTWFIQITTTCAAMIWSVVSETENSVQMVNVVIQMNTASMALWGLALAVLGVNVYQRSQDKKVKAGIQPKGVVAGLKKILGR